MNQRDPLQDAAHRMAVAGITLAVFIIAIGLVCALAGALAH